MQHIQNLEQAQNDMKVKISLLENQVGVEKKIQYDKKLCYPCQNRRSNFSQGRKAAEKETLRKKNFNNFDHSKPRAG